MNIKSKLEKIEKVINTNTENPRSFFDKYGALPIVYINEGIPEQEREQIIQETKDEYFGKIAKERNITAKEAEKLYQKVNGTTTTPMVIFLVS